MSTDAAAVKDARTTAEIVAALRTPGFDMFVVVREAADRLDKLEAEVQDQARHWSDAFATIDALRPPCPMCGGTTVVNDLVCDNCGASASLPLGMTCSNHLAKPSLCPDCVDGKVSVEWLARLFTAVWDDGNTFMDGVRPAIHTDHLRGVR